MKTTDFSLDQSNRFLSQAVSKEKLNFCSFITTGLKHNISVIAKYSPTALFDGFVTLDENLRTVYVDDFTDYYYGISPKVDSALIIDSISKLRFSDLDGIDKFISEHSDCFMLHPSQEDSLLNLARYLIIAYSSNYGIKVYASPECLEISKAADPAGRIIVKSDNMLIALASADTLDEAVVQATKNMIDYLVSFQHHTLDYAWNVLAIAGHVRICQFANKLKTARCELPFSLTGSMQRP